MYLRKISTLNSYKVHFWKSPCSLTSVFYVRVNLNNLLVNILKRLNLIVIPGNLTTGLKQVKLKRKKNWNIYSNLEQLRFIVDFSKLNHHSKEVVSAIFKNEFNPSTYIIFDAVIRRLISLSWTMWPTILQPFLNDQILRVKDGFDVLSRFYQLRDAATNLNYNYTKQLIVK